MANKAEKIVNYLFQNWQEFELLARHPHNYSIADQLKDKFHITYGEAKLIVKDVRLLRECFK